MKDIINKSYFNRRNYILDNSDKLNMNCEELLVILEIDFLQEQGINVNYELLAQKTHLDIRKIDRIINNLQEKNYLEISFENRRVNYNIDRVFFSEDNNHDIDSCKGIIDLFENAFGRPLSNSEVTKVRMILDNYEILDIQHAINKSIAYEKVSVDYIEAILRNNNES